MDDLSAISEESSCFSGDYEKKRGKEKSYLILGDLYSPIISWDFLFSSSPVSAHDDVSGSKVVSRGCVVSFWTSNGADKVDFCHLKSP